MARYNQTLMNREDSSRYGNAAAAVVVTVLNEQNGAADIYSDEAMTSLISTSQVVSDEYGFFEFFAVPGNYKLRIGSPEVIKTIDIEVSGPEPLDVGTILLSNTDLGPEYLSLETEQTILADDHPELGNLPQYTVYTDNLINYIDLPSASSPSQYFTYQLKVK